MKMPEIVKDDKSPLCHPLWALWWVWMAAALLQRSCKPVCLVIDTDIKARIIHLMRAFHRSADNARNAAAHDLTDLAHSRLHRSAGGGDDHHLPIRTGLA